ncbi:MAG: ABC transporter ATP-binding protein [Roseivirga sp.]|nr:ABC transporter ATP-binding protein [Roseivirga sp.]
MKLEVDSVFYQVPEKVILSDIHLSLADGEVLGVLGRNGSGKSSLFKLMFGLATAESFHLRVDGVRRKNIYDQGLLQYLPQVDFLPGSFKLHHAMDLFKLGSSTKNRILNMLQETGMKRVYELSGGKRRLFEASMLLFSKSPFLILDEPFTGLTPIVVDQLSELIREVSSEKGIIVTDHLYKSVLPISDRLMLMTAGTLKPVNGLEDLEDAGYLSFPDS